MSNELSIFFAADKFELAQRTAKMMSMSQMVPVAYQGPDKIGSIVIALDMAARTGQSPLMVMNNLDIIQGRACWKTAYLIECFNNSGQFQTIEYDRVPAMEPTTVKSFGNDVTFLNHKTRAKAKSIKDGKYYEGPWVDNEMAVKEGWWTKKGSKWPTMNELMLTYRAAAFFIRTTAPGVTHGILMQDEVEDISRPMVDVTPQSVEPEAEATVDITPSKEEKTPLHQEILAIGMALKECGDIIGFNNVLIDSSGKLADFQKENPTVYAAIWERIQTMQGKLAEMQPVSTEEAIDDAIPDADEFPGDVWAREQAEKKGIPL